MSSYSFLNVSAVLGGPGGVVNLAAGAAASEEGVSIEPVEDKNIMTIGADGRGQHSLVASEAAKVTVRLLKTSPVNAQLMLMFNLQSSNSALWGVNTFSLVDSGRGDFHAGQSVAFTKKPTMVYDKAGPMMEWVFDAIKMTSILGQGVQG